VVFPGPFADEHQADSFRFEQARGVDERLPGAWSDSQAFVQRLERTMSPPMAMSGYISRML
jgi:hypothetical protein